MPNKGIQNDYRQTKIILFTRQLNRFYVAFKI